jgi:bacterioferritin-associated ferredoxin
MDPTPVDRCVCKQVMFAELIRQNRDNGAGFEDLQRRTGCGTGCGLCVPYIRVALATGRPRLPVMSDAELKRLGG